MFRICRRETEKDRWWEKANRCCPWFENFHQSPASTAYVHLTMPFYLHINVEHEIICFFSMRPPSLYYLLYTGEESRHVARQWLTNQLERTCWSTNDREESRRTFDRSRNRTFDLRLVDTFQFRSNRRFNLWTRWGHVELSMKPN